MDGLGHVGAPPEPPAVAAPAAHSSGSYLTLATARRFVSLDVPELDAEVLDSVLEVGADGATRFRCPCFVVRGSIGGRGSSKSSFVTLTKRQRLTDHVRTASHCACEYNCVAGTCCSSGLGCTAEGCVSIGTISFILFVLLPCFPLAIYLVVGAASAQAQKRVRLSDVGHTEHEGLPVPVSVPVPGPAAGVGQSAAVVAPLVGHSSPSLDDTGSKPDDPSAAAVLDGGAVASATDGMEDVVVLEPEAAAGVAAAHTTWTLPQALGVVTVARQQLIKTLSRRGGLPPEEASCVVFHDGVPFYKCGVCKVRVHLASGRGALVEHYLSSKHLRSCSLRAAVTQRPGTRAQGGGSWPKVGPSTGAPTPQALGAPAALSVVVAVALEVALELAQEAAATVTVVLLVALTAVWLAGSLECWTGVVSPLLLAVVLLRTTRRPCLSGLCWVLRHLGLVAAMGFRWTALQPCCWTPLIFHVLISLRLASSPSLTPLWSWLVRVSQILLEQPQALHLAVPVDLAS
jgi:hypothetical protein